MRKLSSGWLYGQVLGASFMVLGGALIYRGMSSENTDNQVSERVAVSQPERQEFNDLSVDGTTMAVSGLALLLASSTGRGYEKLNRKMARLPSDDDDNDPRGDTL